MAKLGRRMYFNQVKKKNGFNCKERSCSYRVLLEKTRAIIFMVDPLGLVTYINPAISRFGMSPGQVIGKKFTELIAPEDRPQVEAIFQ